MIDVEKVSKVFGNIKAVDDISFHVKAGETLAFLGTSGCGKTTTLRMINRLTEPTSGNIRVNGESVIQQQPEMLRRSIGYVIQNNGLFPHYTVAENIAVVPRLLHMDKEKIRKRCIELMEKLHLSPAKYLDVYPSQLSGGQQQRVGLARAMAADPPVLLMDEPFGALDAVTRNTIRKDLGALDEFRKKTIIMVTHDVQEAFSMGDRICLMDKGEIVQLGTPADLVFNPSNDFVRHFLKEEKTQLLFKAVSVSRLWELLPENDAQPHAAIAHMTPQASVWEVMDVFHAGDRQPNAQIAIMDEHTPEPKYITLVELITAMNKLNNQ